MPELPEVETTRRGIMPHVVTKRVRKTLVRQPRLRWPIAPTLADELAGQRLARVDRRGKYLLLRFERGCALLHLGMSGSLRVVEAQAPAGRHDHVDIVFEDGCCLRYCDPRRFGSLHWTRREPLEHPLLQHLGPEPLEQNFHADYLYRRARGRTQSIKSFIMDSRTVVGAGNIYANEALFASGIHPGRKAGNISLRRYGKLVESIRSVLLEALAKGGTTLRDFVGGDGAPGYFKHELDVYDRAGQPCRYCLTPITHTRQGQRSTYYCRRCQR